MILLLLTLAAHAAAPLSFHGHLSSDEGSGHGMITIEGGTIDIEAHHVFSTEDYTFKLGNAKAVHLRKGLFYTKVVMAMKDGSVVTIRAHRREYSDLKTALKSRIS